MVGAGSFRGSGIASATSSTSSAGTTMVTPLFFFLPLFLRMFLRFPGVSAASASFSVSSPSAASSMGSRASGANSTFFASTGDDSGEGVCNSSAGGSPCPLATFSEGSAGEGGTSTGFVVTSLTSGGGAGTDTCTAAGIEDARNFRTDIHRSSTVAQSANAENACVDGLIPRSPAADLSSRRGVSDALLQAGGGLTDAFPVSGACESGIRGSAGISTLFELE